MSRDTFLYIWDNVCDALYVYHYIAAYNVLLNKYHYSSHRPIMLLLNNPELWQYIFFQEIFRKNSQTIHFCIAFLKIRNIYAKYSNCRPMLFNMYPHKLAVVSWTRCVSFYDTSSGTIKFQDSCGNVKGKRRLRVKGNIYILLSLNKL